MSIWVSKKVFELKIYLKNKQNVIFIVIDILLRANVGGAPCWTRRVCDVVEPASALGEVLVWFW